MKKLLSALFLLLSVTAAQAYAPLDNSTIKLNSSAQISCTTATASQVGCSKPDGTILTISGTTETVAAGTNAAFGVAKADNATLNATAGVFSCNAGTAGVLGCVKPDGTIITNTAGAITVAKATNAAFGVAEADNATLNAAAGVLSCNAGTASVLGCVKPDGTIITNTSGAITVAKGSAAAFGVLEGDGATLNITTGVISLNAGHANTWSAGQTFTDGDLLLAGSSSGNMTLHAPAAASTFGITFPAVTDTLVSKTSTDTLTNKTFDTAGTGNSFKIAGTAITAISGNTAKVGTVSGSPTSGHCVQFDASLNLVDAGGTCTTGGGGGTNTNSAQYQIPVYTTNPTGTVVGGSTGLVSDATNDLIAAGYLSSSQSISATSTDGLLLTNPTAATVGAQKWSPRIHLQGNGWKTTATAASQVTDWIMEVQPVQGAAAPTDNLVWSSNVGAGGYGAKMTLSDAAILNLASGGLYEINGSQIACSNLSNGATGCSTATGTSGATIPLLNGTNTWASAQTFSAAVTGASFIPTSSTAPTNGMYLSAANTLDFSTNSAKQLEISSVGAAVLGTTAEASGLTVNTNANGGLTLASTNTNGPGFNLNSSTGKNFQFFSTGSANTPGWFGIYDSTDTNTIFALQGAATGGAVNATSLSVFGFTSSTTLAIGSADTGMSRDSAGVFDFGTGAQGNKGGTINAATLNLTNALTLPNASVATTQALGDTTTKVATDAFVANAINDTVDMKDPAAAATNAALILSPTYANGSSGVGATLTAGTVGVLIVDGYTPALNDRILVKNQASTFQNGCYKLTTLGVVATTDYVLTRCTDYDQTADIIYGTTFPVLNGTVNVNQQFTMNNNTAITVGTTAITYAQTSGGSQLTAGTGIAITGNSIAVSTVPEVNGGTAQTSWTLGDMLYASATNVLSKLGIGSTGQVLTVVSGAPAWKSPNSVFQVRHLVSGTTYTPAANVKNFTVMMWGSTGGTKAASGLVGGQGGPGYSERNYASPSGSYTYAIGAAGVGSPAAAGGTTTFDTSGFNMSITSAAATTTTAAGAGGVASGGSFNANGGTGGASTSTDPGGAGAPGSRAGAGGNGAAGTGTNSGGAGGLGANNAGTAPAAGATPSSSSGSAVAVSWGQGTETYGANNAAAAGAAASTAVGGSSPSSAFPLFDILTSGICAGDTSQCQNNQLPNYNSNGLGYRGGFPGYSTTNFGTFGTVGSAGSIFIIEQIQ